MAHFLSDKSYRAGNGYAGNTVYDDVFVGLPKFGLPTLSLRLEDYTEIFESFHAAARDSSIPILQLPAVGHSSSSSRFDYSEVFGGFGDVDFGFSYEELFGCSKGGGGDSSDDAWTPVQSESLSDESDPSTSLERNQSLSNGDLDQSFGGITQLKVSHNKASTKTAEDMPNGKGHIAHFHDVPGFSGFINETKPSRKIVDEKLPLQESSDLNLSMDFSGRVTREKLLRKTKLHPLNTESGSVRYERNVNSLPGHEKQCSDETRPLLSLSDISLKTQPSQLPPPSRPPPAITINKKDSGRLNSKLKASKSYNSEQTGGDTSPTYFDVEIDASSSASVSAAAMKSAVEKAQAKLRSAKDSMERKKVGLQSCSKVSGSDSDRNKREERLSKTNDKTSSFRNERTLVDFVGEDSRMRHHLRETREKQNKAAISIEEQDQISVTGHSVERKHEKEHKSSLGSHRTDENVAMREAAPFYQVLGENYVKDAKVLNQNTKSREQEQTSRSTVDVFGQQEDGRNTSDSTDACEWDESQNSCQVPNYTCQWDENTDRLMLHKTYHQEEHLEKANMGPHSCELKDQGKKLIGSQQLGEIGMILLEADESEECENLIEIQLKENKVDFEEKLNGACRKLPSENRFKHTNGKHDQRQTHSFDSGDFIGIEEAILQADNGRRLKKSAEQDAKEKREKEYSEREEKKKTQKDHERGGNERGVEQHHQLEEKEKRFFKDFELEESKERSKISVEPKGDMQKLVSEIHENEEMVQELHQKEKNQYKLEDAPVLEESERLEKENTVTDAWEKKQDDKRHKTARSTEENNRTLQEGLESEKSRKVAFREESNEKRLEARVEEETENIVQDAGDVVNFRGQNGVQEDVDIEKIESRLNSDEDIGVSTEAKNLKVSDEAYVTDDMEVPQPTQVGAHDRNNDNLETTQDALSCDGYEKSRIDLRDCDREAEAVTVPEELIEKARTNAEEVMVSSHLHHTESVSNDGGIGIAKSNIENDKRAFEMASELLNTNILASDQVEGGENTKAVQCTADHEGSKDEFTCPQSQEQRDGEKIVDAMPVVFECQQRNPNNPAPKGRSERVGKEDENCKITLNPEEKQTQERLKRERELENDRLKKIEEERERQRQREREKDMMSIDRATLEAHERAFVENRERVERATVDRAAAEVRQRALAEARERLEKACAEARERTFAGKSSMERSFAKKASMEARLRVERTAVDRAARERAEKAAAEKAALEARERGEKSAADKISTSSLSSGMRQNSSSSDLNSNFQSMGSYTASRYSHASAHGGGETESPQRFKARLERHRRTAERAQKALAEKNMRDLLAQKEQAERNKLAEGLDAEVKRWSSGKEGNLRALLSTLQYILGPDSGWQPVPLTDVITTVAVKKAYRKATLCVHPDKLQQRGATIHQKYICEKVFDLLKEAWNKFNSEER